MMAPSDQITNNNANPRRTGNRNATTGFLLLCFVAVATLAFNVFNFHWILDRHHFSSSIHNTHSHAAQLLNFVNGLSSHGKTSTSEEQRSGINGELVVKDNKTGTATATTQIKQNSSLSKLGGLDCSAYGGPDDPSEVVYWSDIPSDTSFVSPFYQGGGEQTQYLTFEPDAGGWNNIRMAMETVLVLAIAMGRTLVLPPEKGMYLLRKSDNKQKNKFSFQDFYDLKSLAEEYAAVEIITMDEFLERMAITKKLTKYNSTEVMLPPDNKTDWNGGDYESLFGYLREVGHVPHYIPGKCIATFPAAKGQDDINRIESWMKEFKEEGIPEPRAYMGEPVDVNGPPRERLREMLSTREELCVYDEEMQQAPLIHIKNHPKEGYRLLIHFYGFVFFEDWKQDLWVKRLIRDHLRYKDEVFCAAARIIEAMREKARATNDGKFDTFHIRRGDLQYKRVKIEAGKIYDQAKQTIKPGSTVYIGTDERDKSFFDPLKEHYDVYFLDDFMHLIEGINTNFYGMIDQIVASRGESFFGTWFSTFSGYINRIRGYQIQKNKWEGYKDGTMNSWYYAPVEKKFEMNTYWPVRKPFYMREFPTCWRDIDHDIENSVR